MMMSSQTWTAADGLTMAWGVLLSASTAAVACPWGRRLAWAIGAVDRPSARKVHQQATARLGGLSAALALLACVLLWLAADPTALDQCLRYWGLFPAALLMLLVGLWDDIRGVSPLPKLLFQCVAAAFITWGGIRLDVVWLPLIGMIDLGPLGAACTIVWIVGVINAMNFLDGLDGLAAGTAALAASGFLLISGHAAMGSMLGLLSMVLIGAGATLIVNNFRSPKLFLGDSGSLLLGVLIASMAILAAQYAQRPAGIPPHAARLSLPILILAVPLVDMFACVVRRLLLGRSVFSADRGHIHHMLLACGISPARAVATLCGATAGLCLLSAQVARGTERAEALALLILGMAALLTYRRFGYLSIRTWLHCRRAYRIVSHLAAQIGHVPEHSGHAAAATTPPPDIARVVNSIRRARRALRIDYLRIDEGDQRHRNPRQPRPATLELGQRPERVITSVVYGGQRGKTGSLTLTLGDSCSRAPARIHAKELLLLPLLAELSHHLDGGGQQDRLPASAGY